MPVTVMKKPAADPAPHRRQVTGRDDYIYWKAMMYAVAHIQSLPKRKQEWSELCDMCDLIKARVPPDMLDHLKSRVEWHTGASINLSPDTE